jgi:hypothetical protein
MRDARNEDESSTWSLLIEPSQGILIPLTPTSTSRDTLESSYHSHSRLLHLRSHPPQKSHRRRSLDSSSTATIVYGFASCLYLFMVMTTATVSATTAASASATAAHHQQTTHYSIQDVVLHLSGGETKPAAAAATSPRKRVTNILTNKA